MSQPTTSQMFAKAGQPGTSNIDQSSVDRNCSSSGYYSVPNAPQPMSLTSTAVSGQPGVSATNPQQSAALYQQMLEAYQRQTKQQAGTIPSSIASTAQYSSQPVQYAQPVAPTQPRDQSASAIAAAVANYQSSSAMMQPSAAPYPPFSGTYPQQGFPPSSQTGYPQPSTQQYPPSSTYYQAPSAGAGSEATPSYSGMYNPAYSQQTFAQGYPQQPQYQTNPPYPGYQYGPQGSYPGQYQGEIGQNSGQYDNQQGYYGNYQQESDSNGYYSRGAGNPSTRMGYGGRSTRGGFAPRGPGFAQQRPFLSFYDGDENDTVPNVVYVSDLPTSITNERLAQHFCKAGPLATIDRAGNQPKVWIYKDRTTRAPRGDATVTFQHPDAANSAISMFNGKEMFGSTIKVEHCTKREMNNQIQIRMQISQSPRNLAAQQQYAADAASSRQMGCDDPSSFTQQASSMMMTRAGNFEGSAPGQDGKTDGGPPPFTSFRSSAEGGDGASGAPRSRFDQPGGGSYRGGYSHVGGRGGGGYDGGSFDGQRDASYSSRGGGGGYNSYPSNDYNTGGYHGGRGGANRGGRGRGSSYEGGPGGPIRYDNPRRGRGGGRPY